MDDQQLTEWFESLSNDIGQLRQEVKEDIGGIRQELQPMKDALQRIEARLDRQGGIIQGGTKQVARLITWSEEVDRMQAQRDQRMEEFDRRLSKLEKGEK